MSEHSIMNMSDQQIDRFEQLSKANKSKGIPHAALAALVTLEAEAQQQAAPAPAQRPTATAARPAPAPRRAVAKPIPPMPPSKALAAYQAHKAAAGAPATAQQIACAILDETERRRVASLTKTRAEFGELSPSQKMQFCKSGGRIIL